MVDVASVIVFFLTSLKTAVESVFTFGVAFALAKLMDAAALHFDWTRWHLPSEGVLGITASIAVFYLFSTFIGYWQHRMMHWRWFWHLCWFHRCGNGDQYFYELSNESRRRPSGYCLSPYLSVFREAAQRRNVRVLYGCQSIARVASAQRVTLESRLAGTLARCVPAIPSDPSFDGRRASRSELICLPDLGSSIRYVVQRVKGRHRATELPDRANGERQFTHWIRDVAIFYRDVARSLAGVARSAWTGVQPRRTPLKDQLDATSIPAE